MDISKLFTTTVLAGTLALPLSGVDAQVRERGQEQPGQQQQQQAQAEGDLAMLYILDVEPGSMGEFEQALSEHARWRTEEGDPWTWEVYQVMAGENLGRYYIRAPNLTFEEIDRYNESFGRRGVEQFNSNVGPHIESGSSMVTRLHAEAMNLPEDLETLDLLAVTVFDLDSDEMNRFYSALDEVQDTFGREGSRTFYTVHSSVVGTARPQVHVVTIHDGWAGLATEEEQVAQRFADEEAPAGGGGLGPHEYFKERFPAVESVIVRYRPDLSVER